MKIKDLKKVYMVGIKGAGMTAVAEILKARGIEISGSDTTEVFYTDAILKKVGIVFFETFQACHLEADVDAVIFSTAYSTENNLELKASQEKNLPLISYPELLGMLFEEKLGIAVCGTHGKTTTSAILAQALLVAGADPSAVVGSKVLDWNSSALSGQGQYFVAESDEYQNKLRFYDPWSVILTSVDWDHPDFFPDFDSYKKVFKDFVVKIPKTGFLTVWGDSRNCLEIADVANCNVLTYGFGEENDYKIINHQTHLEGQNFEVIFKEKNLGIFQTTLSGKHNVLNCTAVIALCNAMQLDLEKVRTGLKVFQGTERRFQQIGMFDLSILIDDYAHHPDEIKATLSGARARYGNKKIWTVFHPHTFTRTKTFLQDFAQSFDDADAVIVIDIYGSAREQQGGVSSLELVKLINKYHHDKAEYIEDIEKAVEYLRERAGNFDVLITMGAGDVWKVARKLLNC
ncbi:MAG: UDP-N-acetylmuramate--L-alanine ligase [Candidatus Moranbacteria bacterium]|nr:UDP-N-acetylmuramate--L-alanine ligase [Candidatus Moranbacteria bacterium]